MTWWTKVGDEVERHKTKLDAGITLNLAAALAGKAPSALGLYKRDPRKHPKEPNLLPELLAKIEAKQREKSAGRRTPRREGGRRRR